MREILNYDKRTGYSLPVQGEGNVISTLRYNYDAPDEATITLSESYARTVFGKPRYNVAVLGEFNVLSVDTCEKEYDLTPPLGESQPKGEEPFILKDLNEYELILFRKQVLAATVQKYYDHIVGEFSVEKEGFSNQIFDNMHYRAENEKNDKLKKATLS